MKYDEIEKQIETNKNENKTYLELFKKSLQTQNLSKKTIKKHCRNVSLYINEYLNYYGPQKMEDGCHLLEDYLGGWCIEKCLFATRNYIKESASSIKKFYKCMYDNNHIEKEDYDYLCDSIKYGLDEWLELMDDYDNGTYYDIFM